MNKLRNKVPGIYRIISPSGNFYIGSSSNVDKRLKQHRNHLISGMHINSVLTNAYNKYGIDDLKFELIFVVFDKVNLFDIEQHFIDEYDPEYNISKIARSALADKQVIQKRIAAISRPIVRLTDNKEFPSAYAAAHHHKAKTPDNIFTAIKNNWKFAGHYWKYANDKITLDEVISINETREKLRRVNSTRLSVKARSKKVMMVSTGTIFNSVAEATRYYGLCRTRIYESIAKNKECVGSLWKYV